MAGRTNTRLVELTDRQTEVLARTARGQQHTRIGRDMQISVTAVRGHFREVLVRLGADNGAHAVALGIALGLIPVDVALTPTLQGAGHAPVR